MPFNKAAAVLVAVSFAGAVLRACVGALVAVVDRADVVLEVSVMMAEIVVLAYTPAGMVCWLLVPVVDVVVALLVVAPISAVLLGGVALNGNVKLDVSPSVTVVVVLGVVDGLGAFTLVVDTLVVLVGTASVSVLSGEPSEVASVMAVTVAPTVTNVAVTCVPAPIVPCTLR